MPSPLPNDIEQITFLTCEDVIEIHASLLLPGQLEGVKDRDGLESAVGRVLNAAYYYHAADMEYLAAVYWHGLSANPAFHDGNKRAGFFAMLLFLEENGYEFMGEDSQMGDVICHLFEENVFSLDALYRIVQTNVRPAL